MFKRFMTGRNGQRLPPFLFPVRNVIISFISRLRWDSPFMVSNGKPIDTTRYDTRLPPFSKARSSATAADRPFSS